MEDDDSSETQGDREERARQREMMKEMRARREAEKLVESKFREEVRQQRANMKVRHLSFHIRLSYKARGGQL